MLVLRYGQRRRHLGLGGDAEPASTRGGEIKRCTAVIAGSLYQGRGLPFRSTAFCAGYFKGSVSGKTDARTVRPPHSPPPSSTSPAASQVRNSSYFSTHTTIANNSNIGTSSGLSITLPGSGFALLRPKCTGYGAAPIAARYHL